VCLQTNDSSSASFASFSEDEGLIEPPPFSLKEYFSPSPFYGPPSFEQVRQRILLSCQTPSPGCHDGELELEIGLSLCAGLELRLVPASGGGGAESESKNETKTNNAEDEGEDEDEDESDGKSSGPPSSPRQEEIEGWMSDFLERNLLREGDQW